MSHEALQESLSALMDNEADELEVRRILAAEAGGELHAIGPRYQLARAALHREAVLPNFSVAAAVGAALADEPVPGMMISPRLRAGPTVGRGLPWRHR